jgi:EmrB/QacA subfamily drug resistance transporter
LRYGTATDYYTPYRNHTPYTRSIVLATPEVTARRSKGLGLAVLAFAQFIVAIDYNIVYVALPDIGGALGFSAQSLQWVVSAYAVGFGGFLLFGGRLVDRLGARRVFVFALGVYALASLAGGFAQAPGVLIAARVVQGLGGALLFPANLTLIAAAFAEGSERNRALAVWGAAGSSGLAAGALAGGVLTDALSWKWVLFVNVPLALGAAALAPRLLPPDGRRGETRGGFDLRGAIVATAGVTLIVFGLASGPDRGWTSLRGIGALVAGVVLLGLFVLLEARTREPLLPLRLLRTRSLMTAAAVIFVFMGALSTEYYLLTTYFQNVRGYDPLEAGLGFLPLGLLSMVGAGQLSPRLLARWGFGATLALGMVGVAAATAAVATGMTAGGTYWALVPGIVLWGLAGGMTFTAMFGAATIGIAPAEQGVASGLASTFQQVGAAVGLAALVAVANAGLNLDAAVAPATADVVDGLRNAGWVTAAATVVGALLALTLRPHQPAVAATEAVTEAGVAS